MIPGSLCGVPSTRVNPTFALRAAISASNRGTCGGIPDVARLEVLTPSRASPALRPAARSWSRRRAACSAHLRNVLTTSTSWSTRANRRDGGSGLRVRLRTRMLAVFAEFERDILRDRKRGGLTDDPLPSGATPTTSASSTKKGSARARSPGSLERQPNLSPPPPGALAYKNFRFLRSPRQAKPAQKRSRTRHS
jgi:hypothetical protein